MYKLTAKYELKPQGQIRVQRPESDQIEYRMPIGRFSVKVALIRNGGAKLKYESERYEIRLLEKILIEITGKEDTPPPEVPVNAKGGRDYTARSGWARTFIDEYHSTALTIANRIICFFKYQMHAHLVREFNEHEISSSLVSLAGKDGEDLKPSLDGRIVLTVIGEASLGTKNFVVEDDKKLKQALKTELPIPSYRQFMSDAQTSIIMNNINRAILEMAIACEVATKRKYFTKGSTSGTAFEYLEDKNKITIRVIELIDSVAREVFGESFNDYHPNEYQNIDYLFRSRNKVAHRGEAFFRDVKGTKRKVNHSMLKKWWASSMKLIEWLDSKDTL
jgi:hypothetical protein